MNAELEAAARLIADADALLVTAGAGMGVDSGLPDFRGRQGFWRAYPALGAAGMDFTEIANPVVFERDPALAWGFYGHRLALYRTTVPHVGFSLLQAFAAEKPGGLFVVTSNVDGQFQKSGIQAEHILEIHGSIHQLQCLEPCTDHIWSADGITVETDDDACRWVGDLPHCPHCAGLARPNILMFGDWGWLSERQQVQQQAFQAWRESVRHPVVIELGAGIDIPSIRHISERQMGPLVRINPRHFQLGAVKGVSLAMDAKAALEGIGSLI